MKKQFFYLAAPALLLLAACGGAPKDGKSLDVAFTDAEREFTNIDIMPNTPATLNNGEVKLSLDSILGVLKSDKENIVSIKLKEATLMVSDTVNNLNYFGNVKISFSGSGEGVKMQEFNNDKMPADVKEVKITGGDVDLKELFTSGSVTYVVDANVKADTLKAPLKTKTNLVFTITAAEKK